MKRMLQGLLVVATLGATAAPALADWRDYSDGYRYHRGDRGWRDDSGWRGDRGWHRGWSYHRQVCWRRYDRRVCTWR